MYCYAAAAKNLDYVGFPNPREWQPFDKDWKLPADWKEIILKGMKERLEKFRSFRLFMDICVRCRRRSGIYRHTRRSARRCP